MNEKSLVFVKSFPEPTDVVEMDGENRTIKILEGMDKKQTAFVLLHELIHAMIFESRIYHKLDKSIEEMICDTIADSLIEDNIIEVKEFEDKDGKWIHLGIDSNI